MALKKNKPHGILARAEAKIKEEEMNKQKHEELLEMTSTDFD